jgi:hypothetical protein
MALINSGAGVDNILGNSDDGTYEVSSVNVTSGGTVYTVAPAVTVTQPTGANAPTTPCVLSANPKLVASSVSQIIVKNPGTGFTGVPTVELTAPTSGATFTVDNTAAITSTKSRMDWISN